MNSESVLTIDLGIIGNNYEILNNLCDSKTKVASVLKANAYGLGIKKISLELIKRGCKDFFVANFNEALELKEHIDHIHQNKIYDLQPSDINIYVLNGVFEDTKYDMYRNNIIPILNNLHQLELWVNCAKKNSKILPCIIHIDSGLTRLAFTDSELSILLDDKNSYLEEVNQYLDIRYIISHLASSDVYNESYNKIQRNEFEKIVSKMHLLQKNKEKIKTSFSNSAALLLGKEYHHDMVRVGGALYGMLRSDAPISKKYDKKILNPVTLTAPIINIQNIPSGVSVGYNRKYISDSDVTVATIAVGYADGYINAMSGFGKVYIEGHQANIIGSISMDLITVDITHIPQQYKKLYQMVELLGSNITPKQIIHSANVRGYEVLTLLGNRYKRIYKTK